MSKLNQPFIDGVVGLLDSLAIFGPALFVFRQVPQAFKAIFLVAAGIYWLGGRRLIYRKTGVPMPWDKAGWEKYNNEESNP